MKRPRAHGDPVSIKKEDSKEAIRVKLEQGDESMEEVKFNIKSPKSVVRRSTSKKDRLSSEIFQLKLEKEAPKTLLQGQILARFIVLL